MGDTTIRRRGAARRPLRNRDFARLCCGQAVSATGDSVFDTSLLLWVGMLIVPGRPWTPAAVGGVMVAAGAAFALVGPAAGVFVDRWDRRKLMLWTEAARAAVSGGLAALSLLPVRDMPAGAWLAAIYLAVFTLTGAGQFFDPALLAVTGDLIPDEAGRARAAGLTASASAAARLAGPPAAAVLVLSAGIHWALAAEAASYCASCAAVMSVRLPVLPRPPARRSGSWRAEFREGMQIFMRNHYLAALLTVTMTCQLGSGAITALNLLFVTGDLHAAASQFGLVQMAIGGGLILGALTAGRLARLAGLRTLTWAGLLAAGVLAAGYALQRSLIPGIVLLTAYAAMMGILNTAVVPLLMAAAPPAFRGRVMAVFGPANQAAAAASALLWGWLASTVLRGFRASVAGVPVNSASLVFLGAASLIVAAGLRALASLPAAPGEPARDAGPRPPRPGHAAPHGEQLADDRGGQLQEHPGLHGPQDPDPGRPAQRPHAVPAPGGLRAPAIAD